MKILVTLCVILTILALGNALLCELRWPNCGFTVKNIVCERGDSCPAEQGCENVQSDAEFLKWILHEHNRLRNEIATGRESRGFTGPAANMMALSYDKDLEYTAACNANRCKFEHDKCRGTIKFPAAGQNLYSATGNLSDLKNAVTEWFEEIKLSTPDVIDKFPKDRKEIQQFTQMIWATTTHIGCARSKASGTDKYFLVCNYGPSGNVNYRSVYKRGKGCSGCPFFVDCNKKYPGLCGKIDQDQLGPGTGGSGIVISEEKKETVTDIIQIKHSSTFEAANLTGEPETLKTTIKSIETQQTDEAKTKETTTDKSTTVQSITIKSFYTTNNREFSNEDASTQFIAIKSSETQQTDEAKTKATTPNKLSTIPPVTTDNTYTTLNAEVSNEAASTQFKAIANISDGKIYTIHNETAIFNIATLSSPEIAITETITESTSLFPHNFSNYRPDEKLTNKSNIKFKDDDLKTTKQTTVKSNSKFILLKNISNIVFKEKYVNKSTFNFKHDDIKTTKEGVNTSSIHFMNPKHDEFKKFLVSNVLVSTTVAPDSGFVNLSSNMFIFSLLTILLGLWYLN